MLQISTQPDVLQIQAMLSRRSLLRSLSCSWGCCWRAVTCLMMPLQCSWATIPLRQSPSLSPSSPTSNSSMPTLSSTTIFTSASSSCSSAQSIHTSRLWFFITNFPQNTCSCCCWQARITPRTTLAKPFLMSALGCLQASFRKQLVSHILESSRSSSNSKVSRRPLTLQKRRSSCRPPQMLDSMPVAIIWPQIAMIPDLAYYTRDSSDALSKQRSGAQYSINPHFNLAFSPKLFMIAWGMSEWRSLMFSRSCWSQYSTILRRTWRASSWSSYLDEASPCWIIENRLGWVLQLTAQAKTSAFPTSHSDSQSDTHSSSPCPSSSERRWKSKPISRQNSPAYSGCFESSSDANLCIIVVTNSKRAYSQPDGRGPSSRSAQTSLSKDACRLIPMAASSCMGRDMGCSKVCQQCLNTSARVQMVAPPAYGCSSAIIWALPSVFIKASLLFFLYYSKLSLRISFLNDYMRCLIELSIIKRG